MRKIIGLAVVLGVLLCGTLYWSERTSSPGIVATTHQTIVTLGDTKIVADIADTDALREQGLSGRSKLDDTHGMLFVFQYDGYPSFWMKDMFIAIDMIWLSSDKKVVYIMPNATPESYPESFRPDSIARYVLEVPAGWASRHAVSVGSVASF